MGGVVIEASIEGYQCNILRWCGRELKVWFFFYLNMSRCSIKPGCRQSTVTYKISDHSPLTLQEKPVFRFRLTAPFLGTAGNHIISNCLGKNLLKPLHVWSNDYLKTGLVCIGRLIYSTVVVNLRSVSPLPEYLRLRSVKQPRVLQPPTPPWTVYLSSVGLSPSPLIFSLEFPNSTSYHWFPFW